MDEEECERERERMIRRAAAISTTMVCQHCQAPHRLIVMLLHNFSLQQGLCNGTRLKVHSNCIQTTYHGSLHAAQSSIIPS